MIVVQGGIAGGMDPPRHLRDGEKSGNVNDPRALPEKRFAFDAIFGKIAPPFANPLDRGRFLN